MDKKRTFISFFLTLVITLTIVPLETFHHHEDPSIVCNDTKDHVEDKRFECELSDVILPVFLNYQVELDFNIQPVNFKFQSIAAQSFVHADYSIQFYRGPPFIV